MQMVSLYSKTNTQRISFGTTDECVMWAKEMAKKPIDFFGELCHFTTFAIGNGKCGALVYLHHILADAWSMRIIGNRLVEFYYSNKNNTVIFPYLAYLLKENEYYNSDKHLTDKQYWLNVFDNNNKTSFLSEKQSRSNIMERHHIVLGKE